MVMNLEGSKASVIKLVEDVAEIAFKETMEFLEEGLFDRADRKEQFFRGMVGQAGKSMAQCTECFNVFVGACLKGRAEKKRE